MNKILKFSVITEFVVFVGVILFGFLDSSFWLWGGLFVFIPIEFVVLIISFIYLVSDIWRHDYKIINVAIFATQLLFAILLVCGFLWLSGHMFDGLMGMG